MSTVISVENVSKQYRLGSINHRLLYRDVQSWWARIRGQEDPNSIVSAVGSTNKDETFWALRDISFQVRQGEVLGIIGRNGAGKSTLLKILSRVTAPTTGLVRMKGRITSLLEVGTGFHPELTGRENIFLNGAILGMSRQEIKNKFDEIVSFAEVEKFLDTPVKRYSSGMYVRLAFSVAAHLEPDILIVDEVLAVGDQQFQKKCLGKMKTVGRSGRTVLFVSHNMQTTQNLCNRCILLNKGQLMHDGDTFEVIGHYLSSIRDNPEKVDLVTNAQRREGSGRIRFTEVIVTNTNNVAQTQFLMGNTIRINFEYKVYGPMRGIKIFVAFRTGQGLPAVTSVQHIITEDIVPAGMAGFASIDLPNIQLRPGEYPFYMHISEAEYTQPNFDVLDDVLVPIFICNDETVRHDNYNPSEPAGYFSIPSKLTENRMSR